MDAYILRNIVNSVCSTVFKVCTLAVGITIVYWGYKLFTKGITEQAGDFEGQIGKNKISISKAAPGTFFVVFGSIIIAFVVYKGIYFYTEDSVREPIQSSVEPPDLPANPPAND